MKDVFFDKGLDLRAVNRFTIADTLASDLKIDQSNGFLHIPKTGGTSMVDFLQKIDPLISRRPALLFHSWDLPIIFEYLPNINLTFIIRDPLDRIISGYQSRLRQGRPRYDQPWRSYEATAFSLFPNINDFLLALSREDDFSIGATEFALQNIIAISWNYQHYFKSVECIRNYQHRFGLIGLAEEMQKYVKRFCEAFIGFGSVGGSGIDAALANYTVKHKSRQTSSEILERFSFDQICRMRRRLDSEYILYNELFRIARSRAQ